MHRLVSTILTANLLRARLSPSPMPVEVVLGLPLLEGTTESRLTRDHITVAVVDTKTDRINPDHTIRDTLTVAHHDTMMTGDTMIVVTMTVEIITIDEVIMAVTDMMIEDLLLTVIIIIVVSDLVRGHMIGGMRGLGMMRGRGTSVVCVG